jgi:Xaa-Pro aminopeptidase
VITLGTTSSDIRRAIADNVYRSGAELVSNPHIAIGEDTFLHPSSHPNRSIKKGDPVMIRVGVRVEGYTAVLSRTLHYGDNPPDKFVKDYNSLMQLKETIRTAVSPWSSAALSPTRRMGDTMYRLPYPLKRVLMEKMRFKG